VSYYAYCWYKKSEASGTKVRFIPRVGGIPEPKNGQENKTQEE
jgi:hypothetical protein